MLLYVAAVTSLLLPFNDAAKQQQPQGQLSLVNYD